jgi:truncated hemoglobin YjbI
MTRERWLLLMDRALTEAALPRNGEHLLREFFSAMARFLMNQPGPELPTWVSRNRD